MLGNYATARRVVDQLIDAVVTQPLETDAVGIRVPTFDELSWLFDIFADALVVKGIIDDKHVWQEETAAANHLKHEQEHTAALRVVDGIVGAYLFMPRPGKHTSAPDFSFATSWNPTRPLSPLEVASVAVYPEAVSPEDKEEMINLNFTSVEEVATRIEEFNASNQDRQLLLPLSVLQQSRAA